MSATSSSTLSTSPSRPLPLSRPQWPWLPHSHLNHSSSSSSLPRTGTPSDHMPAGSGSSSTVHNAPRRNSALTPTPLASIQTQETSNTKEWAFTAFEWTVRNASALDSWLQGSPTASEETTEETTVSRESFEFLRESPIIGDGKFKLEIATSPSETTQDETSEPRPEGDGLPLQNSLSLYITSLMVDFAHGDYEHSASVMVAIKCPDDRSGERGSRSEWLWELWAHDFLFRRESEFWHCELPSISTLLQNPRIASNDSFVLCIQIHTPNGPIFPLQPSAYYVPRELLEGLEASLDNPNTGDVMFVCLERVSQSPGSPSLSTASQHSTFFSPKSVYRSTREYSARKRVIWAHADILIQRSEYFATMLSSSFAESATGPTGRKIYTIVVEEADFITVYWLLKWVYGNWLLFQPDDDPRIAVDGLGAGWSTKWLHDRGGEWDWKVLGPNEHATDGSRTSREDDGPALSIHSADSSGSVHANDLSNSAASSKSKTATRPSSGILLSALPTPSSRFVGRISSSTTTTSLSRGPSSQSTPPPPRRSPSAPSKSSSGSTTDTKTPPVSIASSGRSHFPISPRQSRHTLFPPTAPDPHSHPIRPPPPASALSVYQIAHRYSLVALQHLALEHIISNLTVENSFPLLLASRLWDDLHGLVEDYVVESWDGVSRSPEFDRCCIEVAAGEWGPEGGRTLAALFRRLQSPSFPRP
ncbi:hypothetical protein SISNIDRAFT_449536 [Sistotremastrum niveocremeum HHB9708]|uniref:BTB domain-containing protein n=1 Tax=Sistotremastrum niveocremeum HHB9708 TaxID=1314777 RepID=A0A164ZQ05_9AGAM|nr:hypothetical protein SISNIDRAFT_449536 [Sistotremastrum niveocremeum HHB9708]